MSPVLVRLVLWTLAFVVLALGLGSAHLLGDAHHFNRAGALVAAMAALAGYFQLSQELRMAKNLRAIEWRKSERFESTAPTPLEGLSDRIEKRAVERAINTLDAEKLHLASTVVAIAAIGELVHGFGDLVFHMLAVALH